MTRGVEGIILLMFISLEIPAMLPEVAARVARVEEGSRRVKELASLSDDDLARRDIAEVNLLCTSGLPGTDSVDVVACQRRVDEWAALVDYGTRRMLPSFYAAPEKYERCEARFRMLILVTVLRRNLGLGYNKAFLEGDYDASDARNLFIHGLLNGWGGTCTTFPVLYAAVARRLGYPIFIACTCQHVFCRWDDGMGTRFNIEATSPGFAPLDDDHYREWPFPVSDDSIHKNGFLQNLTVRQELAEFVFHRAACLCDNLLYDQAAWMFRLAAELAPEIEGYTSIFLRSVMLYRLAEGESRFVATCPADELRNMSLLDRLARVQLKLTEGWEYAHLPHAIREHLRIVRNWYSRRAMNARDVAISKIDVPFASHDCTIKGA